MRGRQRHPQSLADAGSGAVGHHHDAVGEQHGLVDVVGDHQHGVAELLVDRHHRILQVRAGECVECAEWLVEQEHLRFHGQRTGETDTLLHAAGNFRRSLIPGVGHLHQVEIVQRPGVALGARLGDAEHLVNRKPHVLIGREPRQQAMVLEHDRAIRPRLVDLTILQQHAARRCQDQAGNDVEQRGFSAAGMSDDGDEFAMLDGERDIGEHVGALASAPVDLGDVIDLQISGHRILSSIGDGTAGDEGGDRRDGPIEQEPDHPDVDEGDHDVGDA